MAKVGISNLHYALMSTEDTPTSNPVYGTIKAPNTGIVQADIQVNVSEAKLYADNKLWASAREFTDGTITLNISDLPMDMAADILGNTYSSTDKTLIKKSSDVPPQIAIGGEFNMQGGKKLAFWCYKVQFSENAQSASTKGQNTEFQTNSLTGTLTALKGGGDNTNRWQYSKAFDANEATTSFFASIPLAALVP